MAQKGLGRGLDALFSAAPAGQEPPVTTLPLQRVEPNPAQPR